MVVYTETEIIGGEYFFLLRFPSIRGLVKLEEVVK